MGLGVNELAKPPSFTVVLIDKVGGRRRRSRSQKTLDQWISSRSGGESAGSAPSLSACKMTGPRPSVAASTLASPCHPVNRATSRRFCRTTIDFAPDLAGRDPNHIGSRGRLAGCRELHLLPVVVHDNRQNLSALRFDGVAIHRDDTQLMISIGKLRRVELRRAARRKSARSIARR